MGERSQLIIASKAHEGSAPDIQSVYYHWLNCEDMILQAAQVVEMMAKWDRHPQVSKYAFLRGGSRKDIMRLVATIFDLDVTYGHPMEGDSSDKMVRYHTNHGAFVVYLGPETWKFGFVSNGALQGVDTPTPLGGISYLMSEMYSELNRAEKLQVTHDAAFRILGDAEPKHLLTCKELYGLNIL
jgi:hypothetical protein